MPGIPQTYIMDNDTEVINGDEVEYQTDEEEVLPAGDVKSIILSRDKAEVLTDTETMNASEDENCKIDDGLDALEFVPEEEDEVVNLTEGYKTAEANQSASDLDDNSTVYRRHQRNIAATDKKLMPIQIQKLDNQVPTDSENLDDSDDERSMSDEPNNETMVPDMYLEHGDHVSSGATKHVTAPSRKCQNCTSNPKLKKGKLLPLHDEDGGATEEEELAHRTNQPEPSNRRTAPNKVRRKKIAKRQVSSQSSKKPKLCPGDMSDYKTDSESLIDEKSDDEGFVVGDSALGYLTDTEDCVASGDELDMNSHPISKDVPFQFPEPHCEIVKVNERVDIEAEVEQEDTDEEGFEIGDYEDQQPLPKIKHKRIFLDIDHVTDVEDTVSDVDTENEDDLELGDDEKRDILSELSTWRRAKESCVLENLDCVSGTESTIGKWRNAVSNVIKTSSTIRSLKMCLPSNLSFDELDECDTAVSTDQESLNEDVDVILVQSDETPRQRGDSSSVTSDESLQASDNEILDESLNSSQLLCKEDECELAELRFLETDKGAMNIVIGPDRLNDPSVPEISDNVPGVMFLEDDDNNLTDEEIVKPIDEGLSINVHPGTPLTDVENFDDERDDICRPGTPIPHNVEYSVLSSPKRERIYIKEDKYGIPQVKIEKLSDDFLAVASEVERPSTATEDIEITLEEALRIFGIQDSEKEPCQNLADNSEITSRLRHKLMRHLSEPGAQAVEEEATDEEDVVLRKRRGKKYKRCQRFREACVTDEELLSERDSEGAKCNQIDKTLPAITTDEDTDSENFEVSAMEDILDDEPKYPMETPEIIRRAAVKRTEIYREGPNHSTGNVIIEPAQARSVTQDLLAPLTDTEDLEASTVEDVYESCAEGGVTLDGERTNITQSDEVASVAQDHPAIKENLLYSNIHTNTDVESLDGVEGHRN